ncbi:large subunit ribosomal protein L22e_2, cytoplasmic type [Guillardia theta CCMP2712]|uniref:Large ribosomal subunit protein eL22 n=1 Tax=Guillardia theta (strain CCMP2712) TaxID=905079 RepID=L1JPG3_GUITC|nr:large subunit ribosomal protein L22e_2, cytoplasmic type [Guillardia theta CCMP2712]EKX50090.1 large subunit ribosomal protein L22e_2, cytoplasmic type [Guillardia theta CCMP2712]|eukprot:XP_005837070.1 large subunit ribosomal protein L22e_2, cytoplasmic type [Guillardia theta CCMP2712]
MRSPDAPVLKRASVNCTLAIAHGLFNATDLATYLKQRIKYNGKLHNYDDAIEVKVDGHDVILFLSEAFSTRYIRYLTKKFICKIELKDIVRPVSVDFSKAR